MKDHLKFILSAKDFDGNVGEIELVLSKIEIDSLKGNPKEFVSNKLHNMVSDLLGEVRFFDENDE